LCIYLYFYALVVKTTFNNINMDNKDETHGDLFKKFMNREDIAVYKRDFVNTLGVSKIDNWFRDKGEFTRKRLFIIYSFFGDLFDPTLYEYKRDKLKNVTANDLKGIQARNYSGIKPVEFFEGENIHSNQKQIENYFASLKEKIGQVSDKIEIYFYLARTKNESFEGSDIFHIGQNDYLEKIYLHFAEAKIKYVRFLVLPLETDQKIIEERNSSIEEALKLIFPETFRHIWKCFCEDENRFELYVCSKSSYSYSVGLLDEKFLVKEHDAYENGIARPDMMLIYNLEETSSGYINNMHQMYKKTLQNLHGIGKNSQAPVWRLEKARFKAKAKHLSIKNISECETKEKNIAEKRAELKSGDTTVKLAVSKEIDTLTAQLEQLQKKRKRWKEKLEAIDPEKGKKEESL